MISRARTKHPFTIVVSVGLSLIMHGLPAGIAAADTDTPVDVPDEFGLGERLALVSWLTDHHVTIADPNDVPALRGIYLKKAHPDAAGGADAVRDAKRSDLAAELYRKYGRNPPAGSSSEEIQALMASLDRREDALVAQDTDAARADSLSHVRSEAPAVAAAPVPAAPHPPTVAAHPAGESAAKAPNRIAAGIEIGKPFPSFSGATVDGSPWDLSQMAGKVVLIDAWATWCGPCRAEMPHVVAAYKRYHPLGLEIIGISLDTERAHVKKMLPMLGMEWPQIVDGNNWTGPLAAKLAISYIPTNFLLDARGILIAEDLRGPALEAACEKVLGKAP